MKKILAFALLLIVLLGTVGCWGDYRLQWQEVSSLTARGGRAYEVKDHYYCFQPFDFGGTPPAEILFADDMGGTPKGPVEWAVSPDTMGELRQPTPITPSYYRAFYPKAPGDAVVSAYAPDENKSDTCTVTVFPQLMYQIGQGLDADGDGTKDVVFVANASGPAYHVEFPCGMRVYSDNPNELFPDADNFAAVSSGEAAPSAESARLDEAFDGQTYFLIVNASGGGVYLVFLDAWKTEASLAWRKLRDAAQ